MYLVSDVISNVLVWHLSAVNHSQKSNAQRERIWFNKIFLIQFTSGTALCRAAYNNLQNTKTCTNNNGHFFLFIVNCVVFNLHYATCMPCSRANLRVKELHTIFFLPYAVPVPCKEVMLWWIRSPNVVCKNISVTILLLLRYFLSTTNYFRRAIGSQTIFCVIKLIVTTVDNYVHKV